MQENTKGWKITCDGRMFEVTLNNSEDLYRELDNCRFFDVVKIDDSTDMFIDDEGLLRDAPANLLASVLLVQKTGRRYGIVGDVIVLGHDGQGETINAPSWVRDWTANMEKKISPKEISNERSKA
jgi:hypothetical protein